MIPLRHAWSVTDRIFLILDYFCPFTLPPLPKNNPKNQYFEKKEKSPYRYHYFKQVYHKWKSHDDRYGFQDTATAKQTAFFVIFILGHFLPSFFTPHNCPKNPNLKKMEKTPGDNIIFDFTQVYQKSWS